MAHQLSARMLRQLINEEVQIARLRKTIRETIESMALEAASHEDMDEGLGDYFKTTAARAKQAAKTGLAIGGAVAGLGGLAGTDYADRTVGDRSRISQALADTETRYDTEDLGAKLAKLSPGQLADLKTAVKKQSGMGGAFTGSSPSVNDSVAADPPSKGDRPAFQGGYRRHALGADSPEGTDWTKINSNPAALGKHLENIDSMSGADLAREMLKVMSRDKALKLASSFANKK